MIEPSKFKSSNFSENFTELEELYIGELEELLVSELVKKKSLRIPGKKDEIVEYAGRTNYKIRIRRPNKNIWAIQFKDFRKSIREVLRRGKLDSIKDQTNRGKSRASFIDLPTNILLHVLPDDEYRSRSFIGNQVEHPTWGEGKVVNISETGNIDVQFKNRVVTLKPSFVQLKT